MMKHGIGSPGSIAKAQAKVYRMLRQRHPAASEQEILKTMFVLRARIGIATGYREAYEMIAMRRAGRTRMFAQTPISFA